MCMRIELAGNYHFIILILVIDRVLYFEIMEHA